MAVEAAGVQAARARGEAAGAWWTYGTIPVVAAAIAFAWILHGELQRVYGMTGSAWDLAYYQQVAWNLSQGQGLYSSFARANFLTIHFELIVVVLAAVEKLWPSPAVLLIFSSAGLAAIAPAAYLFFRALLPADRAESPWLAIALSAPIPFWAAIQEAARDFFHPENMALAFALLAAWAGIRGRRIAMWSFCLLTLICKNDQAYTVGVIAILMAAYGAPQVKKHWRFIAYLAVGWLGIGTGLWLLGLKPLAMPLTPVTLAEALFRPEALLAVGGIIASMCALQLLAPRWLLLAVPPYLANVLSGHDPQDLLQLHYVLLLVFPLIVAGGVGARKLLERRPLHPALALVVMLPAFVLAWGTGRFPPGLEADAGAYSRPNSVADLYTATAVIPTAAAVDADAGPAVWLANRRTINDFPDLLDNSSYVVIDHYFYLSGPTNRVERLQALNSLPTSGRRVLYDNGHFQVWSPVGD